MRARDIHRRAWTRAPAVARHLLIPAALILMLSSANTVFAYDVESDSTSNTAYVLLRNLNPSAVFESITIGDSVPSFVSLATATIVPGSIPASASALGAIDFDITPAALVGETGELSITVSGSASGVPIHVVLTVPLTVVNTAPAAQGVVGTGVPAQDPGGLDSDGDGVTDAHEIAFGSNPADMNSVPGKIAPPNVPLFAAPALFVSMLGLVLLGTRMLGRNAAASVG
jgi:hypothetical protein